jgi:hypothetical protein
MGYNIPAKGGFENQRSGGVPVVAKLSVNQIRELAKKLFKRVRGEFAIPI